MNDVDVRSEEQRINNRSHFSITADYRTFKYFAEYNRCYPVLL